MDKENTIQQPIELKIFKQEDRKSVDYLIVVTDDTGVTSGK